MIQGYTVSDSLSHLDTPHFVDALTNPYGLVLSERRLNRLLSKLDDLINVIERDDILDRDRFQLLFESHWLSSNATKGMLMLPTWNLYIFSALHSPSVIGDPETFRALKAVAEELRT